MREIFTYGSVGGAPGNRCFYLERGPGVPVKITGSSTRIRVKC